MKQYTIRSVLCAKCPCPARTSSRRRLTIRQGNALQLAGLAAGSGLLVAAAQLDTAAPVRFALLLAGFASIYLNCHAIGHYIAGRLVGLRFRGYGVHGTDHPEVYPPGSSPHLASINNPRYRSREAERAHTGLPFSCSRRLTTSPPFVLVCGTNGGMNPHPYSTAPSWRRKS
jgi:hypothetical protein